MEMIGSGQVGRRIKMETRRGMESRPRRIGGEIMEHEKKKKKRKGTKTRVNLRGVIWAY